MDAASFRVQDFWTPKPLAECDHYKMVVLLDAVLSLEGRDLLGMGQALNARLNGRCHEVGMLYA